MDKETTAVPAGGETADKWTVMGIMSIGLFMATLDASIVNISLPKISLSFRVPLSGMVEWVIIAYLIVIAGLIRRTSSRRGLAAWLRAFGSGSLEEI